jgi:hypothetical protein
LRKPASSCSSLLPLLLREPHARAPAVLGDDTEAEKAANDAARVVALKAATEMWREAKELSTDPNLPPERREFYRQQAEELHAEMKDSARSILGSAAKQRMVAADLAR